MAVFDLNFCDAWQSFSLKSVVHKTLRFYLRASCQFSIKVSNALKATSASKRKLLKEHIRAWRIRLSFKEFMQLFAESQQ